MKLMFARVDQRPSARRAAPMTSLSGLMCAPGVISDVENATSIVFLDHLMRREVRAAGSTTSEESRISSLPFFFQAEDGIRDGTVTGVQTCALPISGSVGGAQFGQAPCEVAVALGPQLDAVEPGAPCEVELRQEVVTGQKLLLAGELQHADPPPRGDDRCPVTVDRTREGAAVPRALVLEGIRRLR